MTPLEWRLDPTLMSLNESAWRTSTTRTRARNMTGENDGAISGSEPERLPSSFCAEVGRRILLAHLEASEWVLRRVEKLQFERDRNVTRLVSIELIVRSDAPVFVNSEGHRFWLVPLSVMRRRTLINMDIRDELDRSIPMLGLRLAQKLDQSILKAAAEAAFRFPADGAPGERGARSDDDVAIIDDFVRRLVAGKAEDVNRQIKRLNEASDTHEKCLRQLASDPLFASVVSRLRRNFTLYALLPVDAERHRRLWLSFDEPTDWAYQRPHLWRKADGSYRYKAGRRGLSSRPPDDEELTKGARPALSDDEPVVATLRSRMKDLWAGLAVVRAHLATAIGWSPTRVRFQIPGAEAATSYHFEFTAPLGVRIIRATLLAGRPNDPDRHVSIDDVVGHKSIVGLHAVEVPNGSLCRTQVDLRLPSRGWLSTVFLSCWFIFAVMSSTAWHVHSAPEQWNNNRVTNVVLLLVTASAGAATYIAQRDARGVAARTVTFLRVVGVFGIALPAIAAASLVYAGEPDGVALLDRKIFYGLTAASGVVALVLLAIWSRTWFDERRSNEQSSPWDMTSGEVRRVVDNFLVGISEFRFDTPAVGIASAEGWHERYTWNDGRQREALMALHLIAYAPSTTPRPLSATCCMCVNRCSAATEEEEPPIDVREERHTARTASARDAGGTS